MRYVILGTGVAGIAAIEAIRSLDADGEVILVGDDPHVYYSRPGLAYYLTGELAESHLFPYKREDYQQLRIRYLRDWAINVDANGKKVVMKSGTVIDYDRLLIAVGAQAVKLSVPGAELGGVVKLDHLQDARHIKNSIRRNRTAVVIGGGITALELVEGLAARRMQVHYVMRSERYWRNVLDLDESRVVESRLMHEGVRIHRRAEVVEILGKRGRVAGARMKDGSQLKCDLVAYAIGIRPRITLAQDSGIKTNRGILVDEYLRTNVPDVYAAGDVAQVFDPLTGQALLNSLWNPAREQGYIAGLNMVGNEQAYQKSAPFNVTRLAGLTTTIIGSVGGGDDDDLVGIARGDSETWRVLPNAIVAQSGFDVNRLRILVGRKTLIGAVVMGDQTLSLPLQKMISQQVDISALREKLLEPNAPIADLIANYWTMWSTQNAQKS